MKLVLSLLVLAGVMYTNDTFAEGRRGGSCDGGVYVSGGWSPVEYGGGWSSCDSGWQEWQPSSCCESYSYQTFSQPYYAPQSQVQYHAKPTYRYVEIDGVLYLARSSQVLQPSQQFAPSAPKYAPAPSSVAAQQQSRSASQPEVIPAPAPVKKSNGLLSNPTRQEAPRSRYQGVEFFERNN